MKLWCREDGGHEVAVRFNPMILSASTAKRHTLNQEGNAARGEPLVRVVAAVASHEPLVR
jgi:hypothetical protein